MKALRSSALSVGTSGRLPSMASKRYLISRSCARVLGMASTPEPVSPPCFSKFCLTPAAAVTYPRRAMSTAPAATAGALPSLAPGRVAAARDDLDDLLDGLRGFLDAEVVPRHPARNDELLDRG